MTTTTYNPKYRRDAYLSRVDITSGYDILFKGGDRDVVLDELDQSIVEIMYAIKSYTPYMMKQGEVFTTIVYNFYGTTTPWWVVLMYNGLCTPMQIQPGMVLKFPNLRDVDSFLMKFVSEDKTGQLVTI